MTFSADLVVDSLDGAPGGLVVGLVRITNSGTSAAQFSIDVVGLDSADATSRRVPHVVAVAGGDSLTCEVPVSVPEGLGTGEHAAAFRVSGGQPEDRPTLIPFVVSVSSLAGLELTINPAPVRGRRRAKFYVDIVNNELDAAVFSLEGAAPDLDLEFEQIDFELMPGQRGATRAQVRATRLWRGEPIQHNMLLTARGRAATATTTVPFVQRPFFAYTSRAVMSMLLLVGLFGAIVYGALRYFENQDQAANEAAAAVTRGVDTDGDGVADVFYDQDGNEVAAPEAVDRNGDGVTDGHIDASGEAIEVVTAVDIDGDGVADTFVNADGDTVRDPSTGSDGQDPFDEIASSVGPDELSAPPPVPETATTTDFAGTVSADGDEDITDTLITVRPISLDGPDAESAADGAVPDDAASAFRGDGASGPSKIWSERRPAADRRSTRIRQSEPVAPLETNPEVDGIWEIGDVDLFQTYEVSFARPGFDTQSFVIIPPDDGEPVGLDVELQPATGAIRGRVLGPNGPLGGADLKITDGTLVFETTADTDGDVGAFILERVSTPGIYTLTAELRGFGTEVVQVELEEGEQLTGLEITMTPGVGTITGRVVDETGRPLPGAAVSASNGETTRSTSTLTQGDVGFYAIPQLDLETPQTINVELDGYTPEARRVPSGAATGVDFVMVRTTSTISGQVTSSRGGGIVAAGVTITNGDLEFRAATTNSPPGRFAVGDLPPGNYTVTVDHFEHETATQFVEVFAGRDPAPLSIVLPALDGFASIGTGVLVVEAVDPNAESAEERPVAALVELRETRTGRLVPTPREPDSTVRITDIPPGTYTLSASAVGYADAPPRQVTIGLGTERRELELERLGQAGGRMVDSLTGDPVGPYVLEILFLIGNQEVNTGISVIGGLDGTWITESRALAPGEYRIRVAEEGAPRGYRVLEDQRLDPEATGSMRFTVDPLELDTNVVLDIEADPFPDITGRVFRPDLVAGATRLVPIDSGSLVATLRCTDNPLELVAESTDLAGNGTPANPLFDSFSIAKELVDDQQLIGDCRVDLTADDFEPTSVPLVDLLPSDGFVDNDRVVNAAMYAPVDTIGGSVFWIDQRQPGVPVLLDGVDFSTRAIVSFPGTDAPPPPPGAEPDTIRRDLTATSTDGAWALTGQVFGPATYNVVADGFDAKTFEATIAQNATRTVGNGSGITITPNATPRPVGEDTQYQLQLDDPFDGVVSGEITILTEDVGNEEYAAVQIKAFEPDGRTEIDPASIVRTDGDSGFRIDGAAAGTWDVEFFGIATGDGAELDLPENHILHTPVGAERVVDDRVDPGETQAGFDTTLVDLAKIRVSGTNSVDNTPITSEIQLDLRAADGRGVGQDEDFDAAPGELTDVVVDVADPVGATVPYRLDVGLPGFDPSTASVTVTVDGVPVGSGSSSLTDIPVGVVAGRDVAVEIRIAPFGEIIGQLRGAIGRVPSNTAGPFQTEPLDLVSATGSGRATIAVTARNRFNNEPIPLDAVLVEATSTPGQFRISGPDGIYRLTPAHPEYRTDPPLARPADNLPVIFPPLPAPFPPITPGEYEMRGATPNELTGEFVLDLRSSTVRLDAFEELTADPIADPWVAVDDFDYTLTRAGFPDKTGSTTTGTVTIDDVLPGTWQLRMDRGQERFPFIADIVVRRSDQTDPRVPTVTIVTAPLPAAGAEITGDVVAWNSRDELVPLPEIAITRTYTDDVGGVLSDDQGGADEALTNSEIATQSLDLAAAPTGTSPYSFDTRVATGGHRLSVSPEAGYETPADREVPVLQTSTETDVEPIIYRVPNVQATIEVAPVTGGEFVDLEAWIFEPGAAPGPDALGTAGVVSGSGATRTVTFTGIAPAVDSYTVRLSDPLYGTTPFDPATDGFYQDFQVLVPVFPGVFDPDAPDASRPVVLDPVAGDPPLLPTARVGRLSGDLTQDDGEGPDPLSSGAAVTLTPAGGTPTDAINVVYGADGAYSLDVPGGNYNLSIAAREGFSASNVDVTVVAGATDTEDLGVTVLARVTVSTTPATLPDGIVVQLQRQGETALIDPDSGLEFFVEPRFNYRIVVSGAYPQTFSPRNGFFRVNGDTARTVELDRLVTVNVTNAPPGLEVGVGNQSDRAAPYQFSFSPATTIPLTVEYRFGGQTIAGGTTSPDLTSAVDVTFTTLTGDLSSDSATAIPVDTPITATSGSVTLTGAVEAGETYTIRGLTPDLTATGTGARTWTLDVGEVATNGDNIGVVGFGTGRSTTSINRTTGRSAFQSFGLVAQTYTVTFDVEGSNGTNVIQPSVTFDGTTQTSLVFNVSETDGIVNWSAVDATGTLNGVINQEYNTARRGNDTIEPKPVLTPKNVVLRVTGTTAGSTSQIRVCDGAPPTTPSLTPCDDPRRTTDGVRTASFDTDYPPILDVGSYYVQVVRTTPPATADDEAVVVAATRTLTVRDDRSVVVGTAPGGPIGIELVT